jgi:predicted nucleic acid-binding protein
VPFRVLRDSTFELANQVARSVCDCLYLALAIALDGQLATADRKFYNAVMVTPLSEYLIWVEDLAPVVP